MEQNAALVGIALLPFFSNVDGRRQNNMDNVPLERNKTARQ